MAKYTTIRISLEDKRKLEKIARLTGKKSLAETLRYLIELAEKELENYRGDLKTVFQSLKYAKDIGETNAEKVDEYLYGVEQ